MQNRGVKGTWANGQKTINRLFGEWFSYSGIEQNDRLISQARDVSAYHFGVKDSLVCGVCTKALAFRLDDSCVFVFYK